MNKNKIMDGFEKKVWKEPVLQSLDIKNTRGGYDPEPREDTEDMQPTLSDF